MEATSPIEGICTSLVASCCVIIFHCANSKRTTVAHTPSYFHLSELAPMLYWVAGGDKDRNIPTESQANMNIGFVLFGLLGPQLQNWWPKTVVFDVKVEMIVLKGFQHVGDPLESQHAHWVSCCNTFFYSTRAQTGIDLVISHIPNPLPIGAVSIQKGSGQITIYRRTPTSRSPSIKTPPFRLLQNHDASRLRLAVAAFRNFLACYIAMTQEYPIWLEYDCNTYAPPPTLNDNARLLLRAIRAPSRDQEATAIEQQLRRTAGDDQQVTMLFSCARLLAPQDQWLCEVCGALGTGQQLLLTCSGCGGAWYCGQAHQLLAWPNHKAFCKTHRG